MDYENNNSDEELNELRNQNDSDSEDSVSESEGPGKDIDEIKQELSSDSDLESSSSEEEDEEVEYKSLPARTYIPQKGSKNDDLVVDESAYVLLCKSKTNYPCMSFDIINDNQGEGEDRTSKFPISLSMV